MPVIGAFLMGVLVMLGRVIVYVGLRWGGSIIANILLFMGVRFFSYKFSDSFFHSQFAAAFGGLPGSLAQVLGYVHLDVAVSMIVSAAVFKTTRNAIWHWGLKNAATGQ